MSDSHDHDASALSQNQVESLVKAMETAQPCVPGPQATAAASEPLDPQLLRAIRALYESIAADLTRELESTLRTTVDVKVRDVVQASFGEFERQAGEHRWLSVLSPKSLHADWSFDLTPQLCCLLVDRLLGGDPTPGETFTRPMTDIERRLVQRVVDSLLQLMLRAWQSVGDVDWIVRHQVATTSTAAITAGDDEVLVTQFTVSMCGDQSEMRFCIPVRTLAPLRDKLCEQDWSERAPGDTRDQLPGNVASAGVDVAVTLAHSTIRSSDLLDLRVGDIIATEKNVNETLEMNIQNVPKFKTRAGSLNGKKAVQVQAEIHPPTVDDESQPQIVTAKNLSDK